MKRILILWKYGVFLRYGKRTRYGKKSFLIGPIVGFVVLSGLVLFLLSQIFPENTESVYGVLRASFLIWSSVMNTMFFLTTFGSALNVLSMGKEMEFLLSLPLRRVEVVAYRVLCVLILSFSVFGIHFGVTVFYSIMRFGNPLFGVMIFMLHFITLSIIGTLLAVVIVRYVSSLRARQLFTFFQVLGVIPLLVISNVKDAESFQAMIEKLKSAESIFSSPFNVFGYNISMMDHPVYILLALVLSGLGIFLIFRLSDRVTFEIRMPRKSSKRSVRYNIFKKELRAFMSGSTTPFQLIYPYAFAALMAWQSEDIHTTLSMVIILSLTYIAREAGYLMLVDVVRWSTVRTYPIEKFRLIFSKLILPISLNIPLVLGVGVFYSVLFGFESYVVLLVVLTVFYQTLGAVIGIESVLKAKPSSDDPREVYRSIGFLETLPGIALGGLSVAGLGLIRSGKLVLGISMLISGIVLTSVFTLHIFKRISHFLERLDEL